MSIPFEPWEEITCSSMEEASIVILGLPFDGAVCAEQGASKAPAQIRKLSGLPTRFTEEGIGPKDFKVYDAGDIYYYQPGPGEEKTLTNDETGDELGDELGDEPGDGNGGENAPAYFETVERRALELLRGGRFCLFLGGDHSVSIPLIKAFSRAFAGERIGILHFDAHPDLLDKYDGRFWSHACTLRRSLEEDGIGPGDIALLGVRSFMEEEAAFLESNPEIKVFKAREIYKKGPGAVAEETVEHFRGYDSLYITIDIDVLDPACAPGTGTPDAGGLSTRELLELVREIAGALPVKAADVVEVSPPLDSSNITSLAAVKLIYELMAAVLIREAGKS